VPADVKQPYPEDFVLLLLQTIVTDRITVEHLYLSALVAMPGVMEYPLFEGLASVVAAGHQYERGEFMERRGVILQGGRDIPFVCPDLDLE
jgi:hypothetical protein